MATLYRKATTFGYNLSPSEIAAQKKATGNSKGFYGVDKATGKIGWNSDTVYGWSASGTPNTEDTAFAARQKELAAQYQTQYTAQALTDLRAQMAAQQAAAALQVAPTPTPTPTPAPVVATPVKVTPTVTTPQPAAPVAPTTPAVSLPATNTATTAAPTNSTKPAEQLITAVDSTGTAVTPVTASHASAPITQTVAAVDQPRKLPSYFQGLGTPFDLNTSDVRVSGVEEFNDKVEEIAGTNKRKRNQGTVSSQLGF